MLLYYVVLDEDWLDVVPVLAADVADDGGEDLTNISDDRQGERNPNNGKEDAENPARCGDRANIPIANGCEDGGGEEDRL